MRRHIRGAGESFWQPKGRCPNDRGFKEGTVLDAARLVHRARPVPESVCDGRLWRGTGLLADLVRPVHALDPRVRRVAGPGAGLALGVGGRGVPDRARLPADPVDVVETHALGVVGVRRRTAVRHRRAVPGELAEEDGTARPEVVRTIRRKGTEREQRASVHRRFRALRSRPTRRPSARRQTEPAPRERARWYSKICERPDVREARSSDTRPAKWEHAWFARQRRIGGRGHSFAVAIWEGEEKMLKVRRIWPRFVYIRICKSALYSIRVNQEC